MRARFYSGSFARFLSQDPLRLGGGQLNLYNYANQNPLSYVDPTGTDPSGKTCLNEFEFNRKKGFLTFQRDQLIRDSNQTFAEFTRLTNLINDLLQHNDRDFLNALKWTE